MRLPHAPPVDDVTSALLHPGTVQRFARLPDSGKPLIGRCHDMSLTSKKSFATKFSISSSRRTPVRVRASARVPRKAHPDNRHAAENGIRTGHINAVQPVSPPRASAETHSGTNSLLERRRSSPAQPPAGSGRLSNNAVPAGLFRCQLQVVQHFIHQQLPFGSGSPA